jgi:AAA family ATP:ADP antiporter
MARLPSERGIPRSLVIAAAVCAAVVIASQLAGKTARDAIFLEYFEVRSLPVLLAISSALAIGTTFWFARRLVRGAPVRVVQLANAVSAALLVAEWLLLEHMPRPISIVIYIHQTLIGPILVSGFWSIVSERFDPRSARKAVGTVGFGATLGGLGGAILAERVAALIGTPAILPTVAVLQLLAAWQLAAVGRGRAEEVAPEGASEELVGAAAQIAKVSLLRRLAAITVIVTVAAALIDYVFKSVATEAVGTTHDLARLLALFHGVVGVTTALVAWLFGRWALQSWGLARTLATLPGSVMLFGILALILPGIGTFVVLRGAENVLRNSLYREAYEVFYTPLLAGERRSTKTVIDVGVERFGDVVGGLIVIGVITILADPTTVLVATAIALSIVGVYVALQAQRSYVEALERSLVAHAIELEAEPADRTTRTTLEMFAQRGQAIVKPPPRASASGGWFSRTRGRRELVERTAIDPRIARLTDLASGEPARIRNALEGPELPPAALPFVVPLLVHPQLEARATAAVQSIAHRAVGQLVDAMLDQELPIAVRCRIPALIAGRALSRETAREIARAGLLAGLVDPERDLRYRSAEALVILREREPELVFDDAIVFDGVRHELALDSAVWKALDAASSEAARTARAQPHPELARAVNHLATLLALALPAEPIRAAFQNVWSEDIALRGVALEYLENVLPQDIREHLWLALAVDAPKHETQRSLDEVLGDLLRSRTTQSA